MSAYVFDVTHEIGELGQICGCGLNDDKSSRWSSSRMVSGEFESGGFRPFLSFIIVTFSMKDDQTLSKRKTTRQIVHVSR